MSASIAQHRDPPSHPRTRVLVLIGGHRANGNVPVANSGQRPAPPLRLVREGDMSTTKRSGVLDRTFCNCSTP